jgi:hypothetical protein
MAHGIANDPAAPFQHVITSTPSTSTPSSPVQSSYPPIPYPIKGQSVSAHSKGQIQDQEHAQPKNEREEGVPGPPVSRHTSQTGGQLPDVMQGTGSESGGRESLERDGGSGDDELKAIGKGWLGDLEG